MSIATDDNLSAQQLYQDINHGMHIIYCTSMQLIYKPIYMNASACF